MENIVIDINSSFYANLDLYCVLCKEFLCCPIRICAVGQICGKCEPSSDAHPYPLLELLLKNAKFTCKNKKNGCLEQLAFEFIKAHESKCVYRYAECNITACNWNGLLVTFQKHYFNAHNANFRNNDGHNEVLLSLDSASLPHTNFLSQLVLVQHVPFIVCYKIAEGILYCQVYYISPYVQEGSYEIALKADNTIKLGDKGPIYSYIIPMVHSNYQEFKIEPPCDLIIKIEFTNYKWNIIDYTLLNTLLCKKCGNYLVPAAYDCQPFGFICGSCHNDSNSVLSKNSSVVNNIRIANFPCRWNGCISVLKASTLRLHEESCSFYVYICPFCDDHLRSEIVEMKEHLESKHCHSYRAGKIDHTQINLNSMCDEIQNYIIKYNTFFLINCISDPDRGINIKLKTCGPCKDAGVYVQFEHKHCQLKSRWFCIVNEYYIKAKHLPYCFRVKEFDAIIVNVKISK